MNRRRLILTASGFAFAASTGKTLAQTAIPPQVLSGLQGVWVNRYNNFDEEITVQGREVRLTKLRTNFEPGRRPHTFPTATVGTVVAILESVERTWSRPEIGNAIGYAFKGKGWTTSGGGIFALADPARITLSPYKDDKVGEYYQFNSGSGEYYRPDIKRQFAALNKLCC